MHTVVSPIDPLKNLVLTSITGGVAFDFAKAFDVVPVNLMIASLRQRGAPERFLRAMNGIYRQLHRVYRYQGSYSPWWKSSNGIIQGCSLSLLDLNSLLSCILERANAKPNPCCTGFAYADDCTAVATATNEADLLEKILQFHTVVDEYQNCGQKDIYIRT